MSNTLTVYLLNKEYALSCPAGAEAGLIAAAENLNEKMREMSSSGKLLGMERIAVMAALNLSYDNLNSSKAEASSNDESKQLIDKIDATLAKFS